MNKDIKPLHLALAGILCVSLGLWLGYSFAPQVGPEVVEEDILNYQLPENTTLPSPTAGIPDSTGEQVCAQVITQAKNPLTGEVKDFPTPCDVPSGWVISDAKPVQSDENTEDSRPICPKLGPITPDCRPVYR